MRLRGLVKFLIGLLALCAGLLVLATSLDLRLPQDLPWTPLDLTQPPGALTGRKLAALADDGPACRALLGDAGIAFAEVADTRAADGACGYRDAVRLTGGGAGRIGLHPAAPTVSCPVAAALAMWELSVVAPAALRHLGSGVARIDHFGAYSCRRLYGRGAGPWSEHATADAIDIAGFRLDDGRRITVARDWSGAGPEAAFLHAVRDGACRLFATTLSPDYNAAHHDHLHLDQARRGAMGWRACR